MFGYEGGEAPEVLASKLAERWGAQLKWPFLTTLDLSTIHNGLQLVSMIKDRTGRSLSEVQLEVQGWLTGYSKRVSGNTVEELAA